MRIALLCDEYPPLPHGGIGTFTRTYAHGLARAGHDVTVVALADTDGERSDGDVRVVAVGRTRVRGVAWWRDRARLRERLAAERFDVVEAPDHGGALPRGAGGAPVVLRVHGSATLCATWAADCGAPRAARRIRWCERETARRAAAWLHPSQHALEGALRALSTPRGAARDRSAALLVPHPVPDAPRGAHGPPAARLAGRVVLFVGSLWGFRGVAVAAHAARRVLDERADTHVVLVGEDAVVAGRPASRVVREVTGGDLAPRVHLTGRVPPDEVARWMRAADVFLYPSDREAFGLVLLEAMREGLPIVGSTRGAGAEIVRDGVTGLLAAPDDPAAQAAAVLRLLDDAPLRARLTQAAREDLVARFSVDACVGRSVDAYERVVGSRP